MPTVTPLPTATPLPRASVNEEAKVRKGPAVEYTVLSTVNPGDGISISSRNEDSTWFLIEIKQKYGVGARRGDRPGRITIHCWFTGDPGFPEPPISIPGWKGDPVSRSMHQLRAKVQRKYSAQNPEQSPDPGKFANPLGGGDTTAV